jgi:DNA-binding CsgD family transcriptional regulator
MLEALGINDQDEVVYCLSLSRPTWSPARLAKELGLGSRQIAESHERLIDRGLLKRHPSDPGRVLPLPPDAALDILAAQEEARAAERRAEIAQVRAKLSVLVESYVTESAKREHFDVEYFESVDAVRLRIEGLARLTHREVLSLHPGGAQSPESIRACLPLDRRALRRGVVFRAVYLQSAAADPMTWNYMQEVAAEGARVRIAPQLPTRLTIIDRAVAIIPAEQQTVGGNVLLVKGRGMIMALAAFFEQSWASAQPLQLHDLGLPATASGGERQPNASDRVLLRLLSLGLKDEAVARHLGVSVRTTRRQIADLLSRLQASSRFQAGLQAARRGWL